MPNDAYFDDDAAAPSAPSTPTPPRSASLSATGMREPLFDVMSIPRGAAPSPEHRLTLDRGLVWWSALPLWKRLAWSEALIATHPVRFGNFAGGLVKSAVRSGQPIVAADLVTLAYSFARHGFDHEQYGALHTAVQRVLAAREANGETREHPLVRRSPDERGTEYLWGDDWSGIENVSPNPRDLFRLAVIRIAEPPSAAR